MFFKPTFMFNVKSVGIAAMTLVLGAALLTGCGADQEAGKKNTDAASNVTTNAAEQANASNAQESSNPASAETKSPRVVKDELGNEVTLPDKPARVFAPFMEDALLSLGVTPIAQWANGNQVQTYLQDQLQSVPKADFSGGMPSPESLLALEPDLIILHAAGYAGNGTYEQYSKIAPTYVFKNASSDLNASVTKLGELLGQTAEAEEALKAYQQKVADAKAKLSETVKGKKAVIIRFNGKGTFLMGGEYFGGRLLAHELGIGQSKLVEKENSVSLSMELLPELDADFIFLVNDSGTGTENLKTLTESPIWRTVPAVKNGNVYEVSDEYWLGSGLIANGKIIDDVVGYLAP